MKHPDSYVHLSKCDERSPSRTLPGLLQWLRVSHSVCNEMNLEGKEKKGRVEVLS